ncbi:hypothetical protein DSO57_1021794 [Entomophthora muscae]|uniref:Uncharacterized protein n=1 Tax=Entomophthora muscae TaxID=34485 RepID=A0ACC2T390_9FUNG|nr:hypothetical protein DSO57_1021794 [Entomophthora muscae]
MKYFTIFSAILVVPQALTSDIPQAPVFQSGSKSTHKNGWSPNESVTSHFRENRVLSQSNATRTLQQCTSIASRDKLVSGYASKVIYLEDMREIRKLAKSYIQTQIQAQKDDLNSLRYNQANPFTFRDESAKIQDISEKSTQQMNAIINISKKKVTELAYKTLATITSPRAKRKLYQKLHRILMSLDRIRDKAAIESNSHFKKAARLSWQLFKKTLKAKKTKKPKI